MFVAVDDTGVNRIQTFSGLVSTICIAVFT